MHTKQNQNFYVLVLYFVSERGLASRIAKAFAALCSQKPKRARARLGDNAPLLVRIGQRSYFALCVLQKMAVVDHLRLFKSYFEPKI